MGKIVKNIDAVQGLVDFIQDIKPYHSKVLEVLIEYQHEDKIKAIIKDSLDLHEHVYFFKPQYFANAGIAFNWDTDTCTDDIVVGAGTALIKTPSSTVNSFDYPVTTENTFVILNNFSNTFLPGQTVSLSLWQQSANDRYLPDGVTPGTLTQTVTIESVEYVPEKIKRSIVSTDISTVTAGDLAHTIITTVETLPTFTQTAGMLPEGAALLASIDILRLEGSRSFVLKGNFVKRFIQGVRFEVVNGSHPGEFTTYNSTYSLDNDETTILTTKYITDDPTLWQRGRITGKLFGYDSTHGICSTTKPGTLARVLFEDQMVIKNWGFDFRDNLLIHNMENDEVIPYDLSDYNSSIMPDIVGNYDSIPHLVHHEYVEVVDNKVFKVGGGNYIDRFSYSPQFDVSRLGGADGFSEEFKTADIGILAVNNDTNSITVVGDYTWLFITGRVFKIIFSVNNDNFYTVAGSAINIDGNTDIIVEAVDMVSDVFLNNDGSPITDINENGSIPAAVFDPNPNGSQPATYIVPVGTLTLPAITNLHLTYYWMSALHINVDMVWDDKVQGFFPKDTIKIDGVLPISDNTVAPSDSLASTSITEDITWGWGHSEIYKVLSVDGAKLTLSGDLTTIFDDEIVVVGAEKNNGTYSINNITYDAATNTTTFNSPGTYFKKTGTLGSVQLEGVDIVNWYQFLVVDTHSANNTIIVQGDATTKVQVNQTIRLYNNTNAGSYKITSTSFDGMVTTLTTDSNLTSDGAGGTIEPYQHLGMRIEFVDSIGVYIDDIVKGLDEDGGPWDSNGWNTSDWNES